MKPSFDLKPYAYASENLREIAFPLGGIGTGCVSLDGRGGLREWEIFNRPNKGHILQYTFPALWYKTADGKTKAMTVLGPRVRDWMGEGDLKRHYGDGSFFNQIDGLPGFDSVEFHGSFPFARVDFHKKGCPLKIRLHAFNPFIPLDERSSGFPGASLTYEITNTSQEPIDLTLAWAMLNPIGEMAPRPEEGEEKAHNSFIEGESCRGIAFSNVRFDDDDVHFGTAALTTNWNDVTYSAQWLDSGWFDSLQAFWGKFREDGSMDNVDESPSQRRLPGSLGCKAALKPGETVEIPFFISWSMPVTAKYWSQKPKADDWTPWYATQWPTGWDAAEEFFLRREELTAKTRTFEDAFYSSTLPVEVLERAGANLSILHSPTVLRLGDGTFWAWEGCNGDSGCCEGTCSHVWNYATAHAHLFPEMQWSMRGAEY